MYEMNAYSSLSHCGRHSFYIPRPHVAHGEHSRQARLEHFGRAFEEPPRLAIRPGGPVQVAARQNEPLRILGQAALQPLGSRRSPRHQKQMADGVLRVAATHAVVPSYTLQMLRALESLHFGTK